jgi:hypothetical protein
MNRRGFLSLFGGSAVVGPIAVTQIGKPEVAATIEDGVAVLKPGTYRSLIVEDCTFNPLAGEDAIRLSRIAANINGGYGVQIKDLVSNTVKKPGYEAKSGMG